MVIAGGVFLVVRFGSFTIVFEQAESARAVAPFDCFCNKSRLNRRLRRRNESRNTTGVNRNIDFIHFHLPSIDLLNKNIEIHLGLLSHSTLVHWVCVATFHNVTGGTTTKTGFSQRGGRIFPSRVIFETGCMFEEKKLEDYGEEGHFFVFLGEEGQHSLVD